VHASIAMCVAYPIATPAPTTTPAASLTCELTAWAQLLGLAEHPARRWEPKRLRLRIFSIAGRLTRSGRRTMLHLSAHAPCTSLLLQAITTLRALPAPGLTDTHPAPAARKTRPVEPAPTRATSGGLSYPPARIPANTSPPVVSIIPMRQAKVLG
jgi:hypothetical protein